MIDIADSIFAKVQWDLEQGQNAALDVGIAADV